MVPRVAGKGRSFKGAGLYYLHDKQARTSDRVAFTHTLNLPTEDAEKGIGWMAHTAMRQSEIKRAAGGVAKGRKLRDPVYAYSLSWHPDEQPNREQMIAAALETLKRLDLEGHEAVLVAHNDEPHPHIHVIVNRVNPETGIAAPLSNDHLKLSAWAEAYEKQHGRIFCEQRVENNARRKNQFVKDRESQKAAEFRRWRKERMEADFARRKQEAHTLTETQRRARDELKGNRDRLLDDRRRQLKEQHKPTWAGLFKAQRAQTRAFEDAQKTVFGRLRYWLKNREIDRFGGSQLDRQGMLSRAFQIAVNSDHMRKALAAKQEADRKGLAAFVREETRRTVDGIYKAHDHALDRLKERQDKERADLQQLHAKERQEAARRVKAGGDRTAFDFAEAQKEKERQQDEGVSATFNEASRDDRPTPAQDEGISPAFNEASKGDDRTPPAREEGISRPFNQASKDERAAPAGTGTAAPHEGEAERMIRVARERGLDETPKEREGERGEGSGGGQAARAFKDADAHAKQPRTAPEREPEGQAARAFREARERPEPSPPPSEPAQEPPQPAPSLQEPQTGQTSDAFRETQAPEGETQQPKRRRFSSFTEDRENENDRNQDIGRDRSRGPEAPPGGGGGKGG